MKLNMFVSVAALVASAGLACGQTYPGAGFAINDAQPNSGSLIVAGSGAAIASVELTIFNLSHTFFGDLNAFVTAPNGDVLPLFVNVPTGANPNGTYNFTDLAAAPVTVADLSGGSFLASGGTFFGAFGGDDANGIWTLNINDEAGIDVGGISGWELRITTVPTPGATALLGIGGLVALRRRRK